jgi:hypothetical protein
METDQPSPPTESEMLEAALRKLQAERARRRGGAWDPIPVRIVDEGKRLSELPPRQPWGKPYPPSEIVHTIVYPDPVVEPPWMQCDADHVGARDVTPPYRPPSPPRQPPPAPSRADTVMNASPLATNNAGIPPQVYDAQQRAEKRFMDGDWGSPDHHPIRYPHRKGRGY